MVALSISDIGFVLAACFCVNIVLLSVVSNGQEEVLVLTFSILAKTVSNIGWFVMWVQAIEVRRRT
jgi:hypothetical protein